jgi:hypothetical protein
MDIDRLVQLVIDRLQQQRPPIDRPQQRTPILNCPPTEFMRTNPPPSLQSPATWLRQRHDASKWIPARSTTTTARPTAGTRTVKPATTATTTTRTPNSTGRQHQGQQPAKQSTGRINQPAQRYNNSKFPHLVKSLYRHVQVKHHAQDIWTKVPKKILDMTAELCQFVAPPVPDNLLRKELDSLKTLITDRIQTIVQDHLARVAHSVNDQLGLLDRSNLAEAQSTAERQLRQNLGKKISPANLTTWLTEGTSLVGHTTVSKQPTPPRPTRLTTPPRPTTVRITTPISNRYQALVDLEEDNQANEPAMAMCTNTKESNKRKDLDSSSSSEPSPLTKRGAGENQGIAPDTPMAKPQGQRKNVHESVAKENWPEKVRNTAARTIIIADSNLRLTRESAVPKDTELHVFPGMKFRNATEIINALPKNTKLANIVVSCGINHRDDLHELTTGLQLLRMQDALKLHSTNNFFLGVSYGPHLTAQQTQAMEMLNQEAERMFEHMFIEQFRTTEVTMRSDNRTDIHHDQETVNAVFDSILETLLTLNLV